MKKERLVVIGNGAGGFDEAKNIDVVAAVAGRWKVYVGRAGAASAGKGNELCTVSTHQEVLKYVGRFIQFYTENVKYSEDAYDFVKRISIEKVRQVLVEDSNGICARLDSEIEHVAFRDPWHEESKPIHPSRVAEVLESVGAGMSRFDRKQLRA